MIVVVDTNILISALIKDSATRKIIVSSGLNLCYPEISLHEIRKHKKLIMEKSGLDEKELDTLLEKILSYVVLVPTEAIMEKLDAAKKIMLEIDPNDVVFIAAALSFENAIIWSNDLDFQKQNAVKAVTTGQLAKLFER